MIEGFFLDIRGHWGRGGCEAFPAFCVLHIMRFLCAVERVLCRGRGFVIEVVILC